MDKEYNSQVYNDKSVSITLIITNIVIFTLIFIVLFLFGCVYVNADTINSPTYRFESITQNFGVGTSANATSGITLPYNTNDYGVQWLPVSGTSNSWSYIPLNASSYSVDIQFVIGVGTQYQYNQLLNTLPQLTIIVDRTTQATCDGTTTYSRLGNFDLTTNNITTYYVSFRYQCSRLDVTNNYSNVMGRVLIQSMYQQSFTYFSGITVNAFSFIDLNNITSGDIAIINANNQNAQRIIDSMANVWNNVEAAKEAIEAMESQLHSDMQRMISEAQEANEAMLEEITDSSIGDFTDIFGDINFQSLGPLTSIITAPLISIQGLLNNSCSPLVITLPYINEDITLPCMSTIYTQYFGSFFTIYQTIILGITSYWIVLNLFKMVKGFANPMEDRIEVVDL